MSTETSARRAGPLQRRVLMALALAASGLALTGCPETDGLTDPEYVVWTGSANGEVILDADNGRYKVRLSDRKVVSMQDNSTLTRLTVNTNADLMDNGSVIGGVYNTTSTSGSTIVVFRCSNGRTLNITETTATYSYACV